MSTEVDNDINELDVNEFEISDEELTALALAADPDAPIADDAVPVRSLQAEGDPLLPLWYMPVSASRASSRRPSATRSARLVVGWVVALMPGAPP